MCGQASCGFGHTAGYVKVHPGVCVPGTSAEYTPVWTDVWRPVFLHRRNGDGFPIAYNAVRTTSGIGDDGLRARVQAGYKPGIGQVREVIPRTDIALLQTCLQ